MYDSKLRGKCALVTGSTSGIGLTIAKQLMAGGCHVVLNGFGDPDAIEAQRKHLEQAYAVRVGYVPIELSGEREVSKLVAAALEQMGSLDILVHNTCDQLLADIDEMSDDQWQQQMALNLSSSFYLMQQVLPSMRQNLWGRIINVVSAQGLIATPGKAGFITAKHGLIGLTRAMAEEIKAVQSGSMNITCNALCPGLSNAKPVAAKQPSALNELIVGASRAKQHRALSDLFVEPVSNSADQLGQLLLFLCSDTASAINGEILPTSAS